MINVIKYSKNTKNNKKEAGITLITLIITVVVMLMLAGVAISAVVDGDGLFSKMRQAVETYENATKDEGNLIQSIMNEIEEQIKINKQKNIEYIGFTGTSDGKLICLDSEGNIYSSEKELNFLELQESVYTNTGISLKKLDIGNIKIENIFYNYLIDENGKMYYIQNDKCEEVINGLEVGKIDYDKIISKTGELYVLEDTGNLKKIETDLKFVDVTSDWLLTSNNELYVYHENDDTFEKISENYVVTDFYYNSFIDENGDVYIVNAECEKINTDDIKFKSIFRTGKNICIFLVSEEGTLYELDSWDKVITNLNVKITDLKTEPFLYNGYTFMAIDNNDDIIVDTEKALIYDENGKMLENVNFKTLIELNGIYAIDENNMIYEWDYSNAFKRLSNELKTEYIYGDEHQKEYLLSKNNELYIRMDNEFIKITEEKVKSIFLINPSPLYGAILINSDDEICYSLIKQISV